MALIKTPTDYERTGGNWFNRMANRSSYIPIPIINTALVNVFGWFGTGVDTVKWLLRGKLKSAATALASGAADTAVKTVSTAGGALSPLYWANLGSGIATGKSLGTHVRKGTEVVTGGVLGVVGQKPQVLQSYTAGIGSIGGAATSRPGRFASQVSAERGQNPDAAYANYMRGEGGVHVNELQSANGRSV